MFSVILGAFLGICFVAWKLVSRATDPTLSKIPGPPLAAYTDAWRCFHMYKADYATTLKRLHDEFGKFVRVGPNAVSIGDPALLEAIYGIKTDFDKSDLSSVGELRYKGKPTKGIATAQDKQSHAQLRRPVANTYSMTTVATYEPFVDDVIKRFIAKVEQDFCKTGRRWDVDNWVQYLAYDIIFELTIGRPLGYINSGSDFDGGIDRLHKEFRYRGIVGQMPWLDKVIRNNPISQWLFSPKGNPFLIRAKNILDERVASGSDHPDRRDFVDRFLDASHAHPEIVTEGTLLRYAAVNILAGSDTTAIGLRSIVYYVLKHPNVLERLRAEVDSKVAEHPVPFQAGGPEELPYTNAVIHESFRVHWIGSALLERVVPESGLELPDGTTLPAGTIVGANGWTVHFDKDIFGPDVEVFRPERWLRGEDESEDAFAERLSRMKAADMTFSKGPRNCLGRWIVELEMRKIVPMLFSIFDMRLAEPHKPWHLEEIFFTKQSEMDVFVSRRQQVAVSA